MFVAGKKKDKKLPPQPEREEDFEEEYHRPETQKNPMQDFLDKLKDLEKAQNAPPQQMKAEQMKAESMKVETMKVEPITTQSRVKYKSLKSNKKMEGEEFDEYEEELTIAGINAREAIIASEILNPPKY